jgi:hypothetical protein
MTHNICKYGVFALTVILVGTSFSYALGSLTPIGTPSTGTHYSLKDIYNKLITGATTTLTNSEIAIPDFEATFPTLTEVYEAIPETLTLSDATTSIARGIYNATDLREVDPDLQPENIKGGATIFGVEGTAVAPVLEWSDEPSVSLCWDESQGCDNNIGPSGQDWGAIEYCRHLEADGITLNDTAQNLWRLPTIQELVAITDYTRYGPSTRLSGFSPYDIYWSSTEYTLSQVSAWFWYSYVGSLNFYSKNLSYRVRCVH